MQILVTGGAGYIGSHTAKELAKTGCEPVVVDNLRHGNRWAVRWGPLVEMDLSDRAGLEAVFQKYQIGTVIHFAAYAYVRESMQDSADYFRNNVVNTLNLLDAMRASGVGRIVFSSTCATYGDAAGADPHGEIGEVHDPETHLIPRAIAAARGDLPALEIFGTDYPTPDGSAVRDYIHGTDLASAHLKALARLAAGARAEPTIWARGRATR